MVVVVSTNIPSLLLTMLLSSPEDGPSSSSSDVASNSDINLLATLPQAPLPPNNNWGTGAPPECYGSHSTSMTTQSHQQQDSSHSSDKQSPSSIVSVTSSAVYSPEYISL